MVQIVRIRHVLLMLLLLVEMQQTVGEEVVDAGPFFFLSQYSTRLTSEYSALLSISVSLCWVLPSLKRFESKPVQESEQEEFSWIEIREPWLLYAR